MIILATYICQGWIWKIKAILYMYILIQGFRGLHMCWKSLGREGQEGSHHPPWTTALIRLILYGSLESSRNLCTASKGFLFLSSKSHPSISLGNTLRPREKEGLGQSPASTVSRALSRGWYWCWLDSRQASTLNIYWMSGLCQALC